MRYETGFFSTSLKNYSMPLKFDPSHFQMDDAGLVTVFQLSWMKFLNETQEGWYLFTQVRRASLLIPAPDSTKATIPLSDRTTWCAWFEGRARVYENTSVGTSNHARWGPISSYSGNV